METMLEVMIFLAGAALILFTLNSAVRTFVVPRGENVWLTRAMFRSLSRLFRLRARLARSWDAQEQVWAMFTPIALLVLPVVWLALTLLGFMAMFWAVGIRPWYEAFLLSGSSLLTLGFSPVHNLTQTVLSFLDATIGLMLIALLIAYLPTMYAAFSKRETVVAKLEVYAGTPPSAIEILARVHRIGGEHHLSELWKTWETWFAEIEESHTTFSALNFFRSPKPERAWVTAAGAVLDAAALRLSVLEQPRDPQAALCIRAGYIAFQHIAAYFGYDFDPAPQPDDPISITRQEFDTAYDQLAAQGIALNPDRDAAWRAFSGWRINYDAVLLSMAALTLAPPAPWSSDRAKMLPIKKRHKRSI